MLLTPAHEVIESVVKLARKQAERSRVRIEILVTDDLPPLMMDAEQMKQVLLNLILNAIDAMPGGGCLTIDVDRNGDGLVIAVKDTGEGIDPAVRATLFSPFVTTKARGSGLGLAIAHRLVSQHGGSITADDAAGGGSIFQVWLPFNHSGEAIHVASGA
jgi:signal transduction histidine kinase